MFSCGFLQPSLGLAVAAETADLVPETIAEVAAVLELVEVSCLLLLLLLLLLLFAYSGSVAAFLAAAARCDNRGPPPPLLCRPGGRRSTREMNLCELVFTSNHPERSNTCSRALSELSAREAIAFTGLSVSDKLTTTRPRFFSLKNRNTWIKQATNERLSLKADLNAFKGLIRNSTNCTVRTVFW